jgi:hypothetical protein
MSRVLLIMTLAHCSDGDTFPTALVLPCFAFTRQLQSGISAYDTAKEVRSSAFCPELFAFAATRQNVSTRRPRGHSLPTNELIAKMVGSITQVVAVLPTLPASFFVNTMR